MREGPKRKAPPVGPPAVERDVKDEVSFHIEAAARDLMAAGLDEATAQAEALRRFGNVRRVQDTLLTMGRRRERRRSFVHALVELRQDLRFAGRNLRRHPAYATLMVVILALGLAVLAAVFRVVDGALLRPLPFPDGERVARVYAGDDMANRFTISLPEYRDWVREVDVLDASAAFYTAGRTLTREGAEPEAITVGIVEGDLAAVVGLSPVLGRSITDEDVRRGERVVALDEAAWRTRFGASATIVGESLSFAGESYTVVGVMPAAARIFAQSSPVQAWVPLVETDWMVRGTHFLRVMVRVRPDLSVAAAAARADVTERTLVDAGTTDHGMLLIGIRDQIVADSRPVLLALAGAAGLVLLLVCVNLTNLFYAHALGRSGEFAVRSSLGAGRGRLVRQVVTEGLVVGAAGGVVGVLLARWLAGIVSAAAGGAALLAPTAGDGRVIGFTMAAALLAGGMIGVWPALRAGRVRLGSGLSSGVRTLGDHRTWRRRRWLVGAEVALAVVLLTGAGLMVRSVARLLEQDPGFDADGVLTIELALPATKYDDAAIVRFFDDLLAQVRQLRGVTAAGATSHLPLGGSDTDGNFSIVGRDFPEDQRPQTMKRIVTPGYFEALRVPLLAGRLPSSADGRDAPEVVVITDALARQYWPDGSALGQRVRFSWGPNAEQEIVGIVGDIRHEGLDAAAMGMMFRTHAHFPMSVMTLTIRSSNDPMTLVPTVRGIVRSLDPDLPLREIQSMRAVLTASIGDRATLMRLLSGFAALALLLATLGVYAVASHAVQQRRREIGLHMAVGAGSRNVLTMIVGQEFVPIVLGLGVGVVAALGGARVLEASLFGVTPQDPAALAGATLSIATAAFVATFLPAARAARTHPATALRDG